MMMKEKKTSSKCRGNRLFKRKCRWRLPENFKLAEDSHISSSRPRGPMDKASAYGAGDCRFESCRGHCLQIRKMAFCGRLGFVKRTRGDAAICHSTCVRWKHDFSHRTLTPHLDKGCLSEQSQPLARCHKV